MMLYIRQGIIFTAMMILLIFSSCSCDSVKNETDIEKHYEDGVAVENGKLRITQYGITWIMERTGGIPYTEGDGMRGLFANGDHWVIGPVNIIAIYPRTTDKTSSGGRAMNGSMVNPKPDWNQGYESDVIGSTYKSSLNAALGVSSTKPLTLQPGSSLVSTMSVQAPDSTPQVQDAAVLTVLSAAAPEGSFRPPYCGGDKSIKYNVGQLKEELLENLEPADGVPDITSVADMFQRPWIDHFRDWGGEDAHPKNNMPHYGTGMTGRVGLAAIMLHLDFTEEQKRTLLTRFVQLGIDNFGIIQDGGRKNWPPLGGHCQGRKWPILFAGLMLGDNDMKNIGQKSGDYLYTYNYPAYGPGNEPPDFINFQEDDQTFYVTQEDVDRTNSSLWNPDSRNVGKLGLDDPDDNAERYDESTDIGIPDWGIEHSTVPYGDNRHWLSMYRQLNGSVWAGFILAARIMESTASAKNLWNHNALFDYVDRYMAVMAADTDNPAWRSAFEAKWGTGIWGTHADPETRQLDRFTENMWDRYRDRYQE